LGAGLIRVWFSITRLLNYQFPWPSADSSQPIPHPGVEHFVENKNSSAIQLPYDCLVEALFPAAFAVDLADC
jgi:hypothetical protein